MARSFVLAAAAVAAVCLVLLAGALVLTFGRPPQPLPLGSMQWFGEVGATVDTVDRTQVIRDGSASLAARGEFYIVHARIVAPFGLRPEWHDSYAEVDTFAGRGGSMHNLRFSVDARAQAVLDRKTGRPGPVHLVRGAAQHEDLVFDLPRNVEQPALIFLPANSPEGMIEWAFGSFWQPHRFNLRYD